MKSVIRIYYIFWKEGPLLPRLLAPSYKLTWYVEYDSGHE
jgi:hypothetical protein